METTGKSIIIVSLANVPIKINKKSASSFLLKRKYSPDIIKKIKTESI